jgi:hypothetical protein
MALPVRIWDRFNNDDVSYVVAVSSSRPSDYDSIKHYVVTGSHNAIPALRIFCWLFHPHRS